MFVDWTKRAIRRLEAHHARIQEQSLTAADFVFDAIVAAATALPDHPYVYREGRVPNTREMVILPNYIVVYRVEKHRIVIVNVLHARQRYP